MITDQEITITEGKRRQVYAWPQVQSYYSKFPTLYLFCERQPRLLPALAIILRFSRQQQQDYQKFLEYLAQREVLWLNQKSVEKHKSV